MDEKITLQLTIEQEQAIRILEEAMAFIAGAAPKPRLDYSPAACLVREALQ